METLRKFEKVCEIVDQNDRSAARLIPILQAVQSEYRYLPEEILTYIATSLGISPASVFGVATFYSLFTMKPKGKYIIRICDGTACHVKGSMNLYEALRNKLTLKEGADSTPDMLFTLETVNCLGACGLAPAMVINDEVFGQLTPERVDSIIDDILDKEEKNEFDTHGA
ncbi:MAG TPA: NADH-quinone oxidoreductase subunit NuoE [Syntrophorhabdus sp.]|jgi:NADH-quinone oxidoreductase subunit E|nr:NADH-quinone oxidoreductase subunit NuoE [Syntrophorhabdus sp.]MDI9559238.1 NADH-quinone oxidoreductase subunit NuoE [Pseudomonadota bacterium]OPX96239.1 MAG: NADP-reducing hydrogenase subunit HndA [Syntrophorhabdus sp. PtaB.Bin027]OQB76350.1 MAG: NADP-reducing hydrogenase subunit HndA [Deltaproteobacteria bacterium ADurb.Bin135]HQP52272.1 NADH-quinone oxidoreductase subunit NuoE [Syntrophorhabdaceae bacterium]